jgi:hypothetical protein
MNDLNHTALVSAFRTTKSTMATQRGFGLKLGRPLRDLWVTQGAQHVRLTLEGRSEPLEVRLRGGFWNQCPEFMHEEIYGWIVGQGLIIPWTKGEPHRFEMVRISGTEFSVRRLRTRAAS